MNKMYRFGTRQVLGTVITCASIITLVYIYTSCIKNTAARANTAQNNGAIVADMQYMYSREIETLNDTYKEERTYAAQVRREYTRKFADLRYTYEKELALLYAMYSGPAGAYMIADEQVYKLRKQLIERAYNDARKDLQLQMSRLLSPPTFKSLYDVNRTMLDIRYGK